VLPQYTLYYKEAKMITLQNLKDEQLEARKARNTVKSSLLTTLLGELDTDAKRSGKDADISAVVRKFMKNVLENISIAGDRRDSDWLDKLELEREILEGYLPKQLSQDQLELYLKQAIANHGFDNKGSLMKHLKDNFAGQYDGKLAAEVVAKLLSN
jgi:uncharacterized protein YqeY